MTNSDEWFLVKIFNPAAIDHQVKKFCLTHRIKPNVAVHISLLLSCSKPSLP